MNLNFVFVFTQRPVVHVSTMPNLAFESTSLNIRLHFDRFSIGKRPVTHRAFTDKLRTVASAHARTTAIDHHLTLPGS